MRINGLCSHLIGILHYLCSTNKNLSVMIKETIKKVLYSDIFRSLGTLAFRCFPSLAAAYCKREEGKICREEALQQFQEGVTMPDGATREDYFNALDKHQVSLSEYLHQFEFYKLSEKERSEFITRSEMRALSLKLRMMFPEYDHIELLRFKEKFLARYSSLGYCHRRWLYMPDATFKQFADLVSSTKCIAKPHDGSLGQGVEIIDKQDGPQLKELYDKLVQDKMVVEEYLRGCTAIQAFHPSSLNTVRFITFGYKDKTIPFGALIRMGVGNMVVDNTHAGGIFAHVNIETGVIESEAVTTDGLRVSCHPDTNIPLIGFQIPKWDEITEFCLSAARQTKNIITGWDVVIRDDDQLEFVEANHRPDIQTMQSWFKIGSKREILNTLSELTGKKITI